MSGRLEWLQNHWSNVVTLTCIIAVAFVETIQEALSHAPTLRLSLSGVWNYIPLLLLIVAGLAWLVGRKQSGSEANDAGMMALASKYSAQRDALKDQLAKCEKKNAELEKNLGKSNRENEATRLLVFS